MPDTHTTTTDDTRQHDTRTGEHGPEAGPVPPDLGESELDESEPEESALDESELGKALVLDGETLRILASTAC